MKKVLITGANSYIGKSVRDYLQQNAESYEISMLSTRGLVPTTDMFTGYDVVLCATGIAHIKETDDNRSQYFEVNRDLVVSLAKAAKEAGVHQFILLSSMSVYGMETGYITKYTEPKPNSAYGKSKLEADEAIKKMEDGRFQFACLRPPMVYGKGCKGNYQRLRSFALKSPMFPDYPNQRSMVYIGNLCEFIKVCIDEGKRGLFFPQNAEYVSTSDLVKLIARENSRDIKLIKYFNLSISILPISVVKKVFGTLVYEPVDRVGKYGFQESIKSTEG